MFKVNNRQNTVEIMEWSSENVTINRLLLSNMMSNQMTHVRKVNNNYADFPDCAEDSNFYYEFFFIFTFMMI